MPMTPSRGEPELSKEERETLLREIAHRVYYRSAAMTAATVLINWEGKSYVKSAGTDLAI